MTLPTVAALRFQYLTSDQNYKNGFSEHMANILNQVGGQNYTIALCVMVAYIGERELLQTSDVTKLRQHLLKKEYDTATLYALDTYMQALSCDDEHFPELERRTEQFKSQMN